MNFHSALRNFPKDRRSLQLFSTRVPQILPHIISVPLLLSKPTSINGLSWDSRNRNCSKQAPWITHVLTQFRPPAAFTLAKRTVLPNILRFTRLLSSYILLTRLCVLRKTASNFPVPSFIVFFLVTRYPLYLFQFPTIRKLATSRDFPVVLLVSFGLLLVYGNLQDVQRWHRAGLTRSPRWTEAPRAEIRHYLWSYQTYDLSYVLLDIVQAPHPLHVSAHVCLFDFFLFCHYLCMSWS